MFGFGKRYEAEARLVEASVARTLESLRQSPPPVIGIVMLAFNKAADDLARAHGTFEDFARLSFERRWSYLEKLQQSIEALDEKGNAIGAMGFGLFHGLLWGTVFDRPDVVRRVGRQIAPFLNAAQA